MGNHSNIIALAIVIRHSRVLIMATETRYLRRMLSKCYRDDRELCANSGVLRLLPLRATQFNTVITLTKCCKTRPHNLGTRSLNANQVMCPDMSFCKNVRNEGWSWGKKQRYDMYVMPPTPTSHNSPQTTVHKLLRLSNR
ncbi:hypothetical protein PILCRDRAFT_489398 [Piloderma croceum F 1598]|uniref:Uncharacterized protein n=1 Tax=Piloderma croceum (strain F 1598) TaxID=765440 RepID=A0A0C3EV74_PILCF|nr:hypothetical protein PILCRDRAFT_747800 [Piloderma croceum F 1598]KIM81764.1 hypothetical protein PILCRDRAFT_489398 [Piloderma croceum F 1598]